MKLEINQKELEHALQDYVFKKLGDKVYIKGFSTVDRNRYVNVDLIEIYIKDEDAGI